jgi:uncharacterized protein YecT (DUF1311 family)
VRIVGVLALMLLPGAAVALDCASAVTQADLNDCAGRDLKAADARLNAAYLKARDVMRRIDGDLPKTDRGAEVALLGAQRAWISFRTQTCRAEGYASYGGSMEPMVETNCATRLTEARTKDLIDMSAGN